MHDAKLSFAVIAKHLRDSTIVEVLFGIVVQTCRYLRSIEIEAVSAYRGVIAKHSHIHLPKLHIDDCFRLEVLALATRRGESSRFGTRTGGAEHHGFRRITPMNGFGILILKHLPKPLYFDPDDFRGQLLGHDSHISRRNLAIE